MRSLKCVISSQAVNNRQSTISRLTRDNKTCGFTPVKEDDTQMKQTRISKGKDQTFVRWPKQINKIERTCNRFALNVVLFKYTKKAV